MWPNRRVGIGQNMRPRQESQEVEARQGLPSPTRHQQQLIERNIFGISDDESDSESEESDPNDPPIEMLLFTTLMNCVSSVHGARMASSTCCLAPSRPYCNTYPNIVCYIPMESTSNISHPERMVVDQQSEHNTDLQSDDQALSENASQNSRDQTTRSGSSVNAEYFSAPIPYARRNSLIFGKDMPTPGLAQGRRRLRSVQRMAPPSILATQVANRVIKYARCIRNINEKDMICISCGLFPVGPVTGQCGHTRCAKCIQKMSKCSCGNDSPDTFTVNVLIRDLIGKTSSDGQSSSTATVASNSAGVSAHTKEIPNQASSSAHESCSRPFQLKRKARAGAQRIPMSPRIRYNYALELVKMGQHQEAAPHLALAAASAQHDLRPARLLLAKVISLLSGNRDPRFMARPINHLVRQLSTTSWIKPGDMECILCYDTFTNPVTTTCGHMFCRTCLERTLDYNKRCPLCLQSLEDFKIKDTRNTMFVQAALKSINAVKAASPMEPDLIPIFVCTVAFPSVSCPLFIFDPRYWLMIRRVLESGSRTFGMVACENREQDYAGYGTILEVRDCVHLEDGRSILSTVGLSRFKVIERGVRDGCEVARIIPIIDLHPNEEWAIWELKTLAFTIFHKAMYWLNRLDLKLVADIEAAFGNLPIYQYADEGWDSNDGPSWIWWFVAVLPLRTEIKVLILSTDSLLKRLTAVSRTLELIEEVDFATTPPANN